MAVLLAHWGRSPITNCRWGRGGLKNLKFQHWEVLRNVGGLQLALQMKDDVGWLMNEKNLHFGEQHYRIVPTWGATAPGSGTYRSMVAAFLSRRVRVVVTC